MTLEYDEAAIAKLWDRYYPVLAKLAERQLAAIGVQQRTFDGEDVAASALGSFFKGLQLKRFPELDTEDSLFRLLRKITMRKVIDRKRQTQSQKRGGGKVRGESAFGSKPDSTSSLGIDAVQDDTPSPEEIAIVTEECQGLFAMLTDQELQRIACLRMEGYSNSEIAKMIGKSVATVERRLAEIRACWKTSMKS